MANKFARGHNFTDGPPNDDVMAAYLHALIEEAAPTTAFVDDQVEKSLVAGDYAFVKDTPGNRLAKVKTDALLGQVQSGITLGNIQVPDNALQNADMWYWQRGLNVDRVINGTNLKLYGPDRFQLNTYGTWNIKIRNLDDQDLVLSGYPRQNRVARITAVGAHSTIAAGAWAIVRYTMEGLDFARIDGLPWVYTQWVRTNRTGTMYASVRIYAYHYDASYEYYTQDFLINPNGVTQLQMFFPARTSNLAVKNDNAALGIDFVLAAATNLQGPASTSWASGAGNQATTRQTNFFDAANNYVDIWGPCLRTGSIAVPHRVSSAGSNELSRLQRYYCKSYLVDTNPGTATPTGLETITMLSATYSRGKVNFPTAMRIAPTVTAYSEYNGNVNEGRNAFLSTNIPITAIHFINENGFGGVGTTGGTARDALQFQYTAEADF
jgi:hypothetical protein